ncbi:MAG: hypothetical protein LUC91_04250, partial [Prevotella sp.]|nr:hypothetical protein [Prevotella sp.]
MKKTVFLLSMLFACTCVSAQNEITKIGEVGYAFYNPAYYMCPKEFYYEGNVKYIIRDYESELLETDYRIWIFDIYDDQLQKEKTVKAPLEQMTYINFDTNTSFYDNDVTLTQTLFNNDELYEWVELVENGTNYTGFKVMQEGDVELCSVDFGIEAYYVWFYIYIVNENVYLVADIEYGENGVKKEPFYFYLIDSGEDTGIKYVGKVNGMSVSPTIL